MTPGGRRAQVLVSTDWVADHLADPDVRVLQIDKDPFLYELGHIPGAATLSWDHDVQSPWSRDIVDAEGFAALMGRLGCRRDTTIVLYGDMMNGWATYAYWILTYWGHPDVRIMDGGHQKWTREGRELTIDPAAAAADPAQYPVPEPCREVRAFTADVVAAVHGGATTLLDARSEAEFGGEIYAGFSYPLTGAHRGGHVPGARNVPWRGLTDDGCFRPDAELRDLYAGAGVDLDRPVIAYCIIGIGSSSTFFVLRDLLGVRDVRNYDGSWMEWGSTIGLPVERT